MVFKDNSEGSYVYGIGSSMRELTITLYWTLDGVVANYRLLAGASPADTLVFSVIFSQEKNNLRQFQYLINTLKGISPKAIPIDMIVRDWNYWPRKVNGDE